MARVAKGKVREVAVDVVAREVAVVLEEVGVVAAVLAVVVDRAEAGLPVEVAEGLPAAVDPEEGHHPVAEEVVPDHEDICSLNFSQRPFDFGTGFCAHADDLGHPAHVRHGHGCGGVHLL